MSRYLYSSISYLFKYLLNLNIRYRKIYFILIDIFLVLISFLLSTWFLNLKENFLNIFLFISFTLVYFIFGNYYKSLTRYYSSTGFYKLSIKNLLLIFIIKLIFFSLGIYYPLKFWLLIWLLISSFLISIRVFSRDLLTSFNIDIKDNLKKVAILGTGQIEVQLSKQIKLTGSHNIVTFIDENRELWNREINGIKVKPLDVISDLEIDQLLVSNSSINSSSWPKIIDQLKKLKPGIEIYKIPSLNSIEEGKERIDALKPISLEDLLFRKSVPPKNDLLGPGITSKVVMVTGAAGSIGKELSLQILALNPLKLILIDFSEPSLFELKNFLDKENTSNKEIFYELGNTCDYKFMYKIFKSYKPYILFHASAYKHVALLEHNQIEAVKNNIFSTINICKLALEFKTYKTILISSDKAVRPTSLMGVTKRISELIISSYANQFKNPSEEDKLVFSMVRFGNVLGSSGSVVPIFQKQIERGGPLTITHPEVTRYFMTISEAASLVIQSSVLAKGDGEVFLLDMGKPMKIIKLAEQMILLNGLTVKNDLNPQGDISIIYSGLRKGEKLFEELLIDAKSESTDHPLIFKAIENSLDLDYLMQKIYNLEISLNNNDLKTTIKILKEIVPEWLRDNIVG